MRLPLRLPLLAAAIIVATGWSTTGDADAHRTALTAIATEKSSVLEDLETAKTRLASTLVTVEVRRAMTEAESQAIEAARALPAPPRPLWATEPLGKPAPHAVAAADEEPGPEQVVLALEREREEVAARLDDIDLQAQHVLQEIEMLEAEAAARGHVLAVSRGRARPAGGPPDGLPAQAQTRQARDAGGPPPAVRASGRSTGFVWPTEGILTSEFGPRWGRLHAGIDVAADIGTPIVAAADGEVRFAGWMRGYGVTTIIDHANGVSTLYAHQNELGVAEGQRVEQGQLIGWVGNTGVSTAPHLHFEKHVGGVPQDPLLSLPRAARRA